MKCKFLFFLGMLLFCASGVFAQLGIKAGVNIANEINSYSQSEIKAGFNSTNLTGYQIGLVYQVMPKITGVGIEAGVLLSQKGSTFSDSSNIANGTKQGYRELNYLEIPIHIRYHLLLGAIAIYGIGGLYGAYKLSGKTVDENSNTSQNETFTDFASHVDYGFNIGAGVELFRKIQFGTTLSQGLKNTSTITAGLPTPLSSKNRVYSVNLVYLF